MEGETRITGSRDMDKKTNLVVDNTGKGNSIYKTVKLYIHLVTRLPLDLILDHTLHSLLATNTSLGIGDFLYDVGASSRVQNAATIGNGIERFVRKGGSLESLGAPSGGGRGLKGLVLNHRGRSYSSSSTLTSSDHRQRGERVVPAFSFGGRVQIRGQASQDKRTTGIFKHNGLLLSVS